MLVISANGQELDLPTNIQVSLTIENPFMTRDRIPTPYSLPFDLPPTTKNLKIFNFPNRIGSYNLEGSMTQTLPCNILFSGVNIAIGYISVTQFDNSIKANFKVVEITENIRKGLFEVPLDVLEFTGGDYADPHYDDPEDYSYKYKQMAIDAANGTNDKFVVAPIRIKDIEPMAFISQDGKEYGDRLSSELLMDSQYFNFYNPVSENFTLTTDTPVESINPIAHSSIFPFLRLHYLFEHLLGDTLINNIFTEGELRDLVIPSTYFDNWSFRDMVFYLHKETGMMFNNNPSFALDPGTPTVPYFKLNSFLPNMLGSELVKQVLNLFCTTLVAVKGKFEIRYNKDIIAKPVAEDWSNRLIEKLTISVEEKKTYKYGYGINENYTEKPYITEVGSIHEMVRTVDIPSLNESSTSKVYKIISTGECFQKTVSRDKLSDDNEKLWVDYKLLDGNLDKYIDISGNTFDVVSKLKPLPMYPEQYWWSTKIQLSPEITPELAWWHVPRWEGEREQRSDHAYIMFYRGMVEAEKDGESYPYITPYNVAPDGSQTGTLSLSWNGTEGLLNNFHSEFKNWVEKDKVKVSGSFLLTMLDLHQLDITDKVHINGRNFFIEKMQVTIRHNRIDPAVVDFIEA